MKDRGLNLRSLVNYLDSSLPKHHQVHEPCVLLKYFNVALDALYLASSYLISQIQIIIINIYSNVIESSVYHIFCSNAFMIHDYLETNSFSIFISV